MKNDHRSKFSSLSNWRKKPENYQGFNGIQTRDLRDTGAMLDQLSCEATHWQRGQFVEFISSRAVKYTFQNNIMLCEERLDITERNLSEVRTMHFQK